MIDVKVTVDGVQVPLSTISTETMERLKKHVTCKPGDVFVNCCGEEALIIRITKTYFVLVCLKKNFAWNSSVFPCKNVDSITRAELDYAGFSGWNLKV